MSLQQKILTLIGGIPDPATRVDIATTVNYLFQLYVGGHINEETARTELYNVCHDVISITYPDLTEEEVRKKANQLAEEFMKVFRVENVHRRMVSRFGSATRLPY